MSSKLGRIMLVEDDPSLRLVAQIALERVGGFCVLACSSGQAALDSIVEFAPALVLLDVMMPILDGPATLKQLRALPGYKTLPVIYLTAKIRATEISDLMATGAIGVLAKPFDPMTLSRSVAELWNSQCRPAQLDCAP